MGFGVKRLRELTQKYSLFSFVFISYLLVLLFSILFNLYNYTAYNRELKEQKRLYDQVMFQQFDEMIGRELDKADALLVNILTDTDILKVVSADDLISGKQLSQTLRGSVQMRSYSQTAASSMYMYFENGDGIIKDGSYYRPEAFYARFMDEEKISFEDWLKQQSAQHYRSYEQGNTKNNNEMVLYHTVTGMPADKKALIAVWINLEDIFSIFQDSFFSGQMAFQITDSDGEILASYGGESFEDVDRQQIAPYTSGRTGWTYISAIPSSIYNSEANELLRRTAIVLLIELVIGVLLAFLFARSNTEPIRAIYRRLTGQGHVVTDKVKNEYRLVDSCLESLLVEKDQLLEHHNQVVKNNMLLAILNNSISRDELEEDYLLNLGVDLAGPEFQVIDIMMDYEETQHTNGLENQSLMKYHLVSLVSKAFAAKFHPSLADVSWNQMAVILNGSGMEEQTNFICQSLEELKDRFEGEFDVFLTVGVGGVHNSFEGINASYRESAAALEYRILEDRGSVCSYRDIGGRGGSKFTYPAIDKAKIKAKIRSCDGPGATALLDKVFAGIATNRVSIPLEVAKCLFFEIMGIGLEVLAEIKFEHEKSHSEYMEMLFGCQTIGQLQRTLSRILLEICDSVKRGQSSRNQQLLDRIDAYIERHCYDNSFSLVSLADHLNLTPTYLSSFFKEKLGENMVDRITKLRMTRAKELLRDTNRNVAEIAVQVGYSSSGTFIRGFKKLEGITPTQYRQEHLDDAGENGDSQP